MKNFIQFTLATLLAFNLGANSNAIRIKITGNGYSDETVVRLHANATVYFDGNYDAWKLISSNPNVPSIYTQISPTQKLSINALPKFNKDTSISVFTNIPASGNYAITLSEVFPLDSSYKISLTDNSTGIHYFFKGDTTFNFQLQSMQPQASFTFNISKAPQITVLDEDCFGNKNGSAQVLKNGNTNWQLSLYDSQNTFIKTFYATTSIANLDSLSAGNYKIELTSKGIVEVSGFTINPGVIVSANYSLASDTIYLSEGGNLLLNNNSTNSLTYYWDFGDGNSSTQTSPTHSYTNIGNYEVGLKAFNGNCLSEKRDSIVVKQQRPIITSVDKNLENEFQLLSKGNDVFEINSSITSNKILSVLDLNGKLLIQQNFNTSSFSFSLNEFEKGIYLINIYSSEAAITKKVFVF